MESRLPVRSSPTCATKRCFVRSAREACDCAVVAIGSDLATCIIATLNLKDLGVPQVICKATDLSCVRRRWKRWARTASSSRKAETGIKLAQAITSSSILDFIELSKDCGIAEIPTPESWFGKTLRELNIRAKYGVNIIAIRHDGKIDVAPGAGSCVEKEHTVLVVLERTTSWQSCAHEAGTYHKPAESTAGPYRKLQASRSYRKASGEFAAEGTKASGGSGKMVSGASHGRLPRGFKIM